MYKTSNDSNKSIVIINCLINEKISDAVINLSKINLMQYPRNHIFYNYCISSIQYTHSAHAPNYYNSSAHAALKFELCVNGDTSVM